MSAELHQFCREDRQQVLPGSFEAARLPYIGLEQIESETGEISRLETNLEGSSVSSTFRFDPRHVLYGKLRPYLNKVALPKFEGRCTTEAIPLLPSPELDRRYLAWFLRRPETVTRVMAEKTGSRMPRADMNTLMALKIPLPPLPEQRRIADRLDVAKAQQARARAAAEGASIDINAVARRLESEMFVTDVEPVAMADIIADTRNGIYKPDHFYGRGTPILKMFNIGRFTNEIVTAKVDMLEVTEAERAKGQLKKGDILVNRVNSRELVGKCAYVGADCAGFMFESKNLRLAVKREFADPNYVALWLNSAGGRRQIEDKLKQIAGMATISRPDLDALSIPLPPLLEQRKRLSIYQRQLGGVKAARAAAAAQLAGIDALPGALLSAAFRGDL